MAISSQSESQSLIQLKDLSHTFYLPEQQVNALKNISMDIKEKEAVVILGPSGSGKTTLLDVLGTLLTPQKGHYLFKGSPIFKKNSFELSLFRNQSIGFIFQNFRLIPRFTAFQNVQLPFEYSKNKKNIQEKVQNALSMVSMEHKRHVPCRFLSGGEMQRIAIARAIVMDPELILADEPTGNLDSKNGEKIFQLLIQLNKQGKTLIMITHNEQLASSFPRIIKLFDGSIVYDGSDV